MDFTELPEHYSNHHLTQEEMSDNPYSQFIQWMNKAKEEDIEELNAMALATASSKGIPSSRMVLLKHIDEQGLIFYTNYESRKAKEIEENPHASAVIFWPKMMRQICVEGAVEKVSKENSEKYFHSRHRESQIAAWGSVQGKKITSRQELLNRCEAIKRQYEGKEIPLPPFWGGFRLIPSRFEFWVGGHYRLHDRFEYSLKNGVWVTARLSP